MEPRPKKKKGFDDNANRSERQKQLTTMNSVKG